MDSVLEGPLECFKNKEYCDLELVAAKDNKSAYLSALFDPQSKTADQSVYVIPDVSGHILEMVVGYCYQKQIEIKADRLDAVLKVASFLQMAELLSVCTQTYKEMMLPSNCLSIWKTAEQYGLQELESFATAFTCRHIGKVVNCDEFMHISSTHLGEILKSDEPRIDGEKEVFSVVMQWIRFNVDERKSSFGALVEHVRCQHLGETSLSETVYSACSELGFGFEMVSRIDLNILKNKRLNQRTSLPREICAMAGFYGRCTSHRRIYMYDIKSDIWKSTISFESSLIYKESYILVDDDLIVLRSAHSYDGIWPSLLSINVYTGKVKEMKTLPFNGRNMALAHFNNEIFCFGGTLVENHNSRVLNDVVKYNLERDEWIEVAPMLTARSESRAVVICKKIFVMAGRIVNNFLRSMEYFEPKLNRWFPAAPMLSARETNFTTGVSNGFIYVMGGREDGRFNTKIEKYSVETDTWTRLTVFLVGVSYSAIFVGEWIYMCRKRPAESFDKISVYNGETVTLKNLEKLFVLAQGETQSPHLLHLM